MPAKYKDGSVTLEDIMTPNGLAQVKALIRFYFQEDPKDFEHTAKLWSQLKFSLQFDGKLKISEVIEK